MLRESDRLIRALPCIKNNRERLPVARLSDKSGSFCFLIGGIINISDIQRCADFFQEHYLKTFYLVITYDGKSFILIGEKTNFPHLMGIQNRTYKSNGYNRPQHLFNDIIGRNPVSTAIIPNNISTTSKMYKKILNFTNSTDIFWKNHGPLAINYNPTFSNSKLNHVDVLLADIHTGYMLGWVSNNKVSVNANINMEKFCICTWIDESHGTQTGKEKYMLNQDVELIRYIFAFNENSQLIRKKEYSYSQIQKIDILKSCERSNSNLLIDNVNAHHYRTIASQQGIHCKINGILY